MELPSSPGGGVSVRLTILASTYFFFSSFFLPVTNARLVPCSIYCLLSTVYIQYAVNTLMQHTEYSSEGELSGTAKRGNPTGRELNAEHLAVHAL